MSRTGDGGSVTDPSTVDLSVVIVHWNTRDDLLRCLESIERETRCAVEVIVVDNGSVDGAMDAVARAHPGVRRIELGENVGFAAANNIGLEAANGRHVLVLNPDTEIVDAGLDRLVTWMDAHPGAAAVGCRLRNAAGVIETSVGEFPSARRLLARALRTLRGARDPATGIAARAGGPVEVDWVTGAFLALRRSVVDAGVRFDPGYALYFEDVDLCRQLRRRGMTVLFVPETWALHRRGAAPLGRSRRRLRRRGESRYHRKEGGLGGRLLSALYWSLAGGWWGRGSDALPGARTRGGRASGSSQPPPGPG